MFERLKSEDAAKLASVALVILTSGLAGQFAAHGMNLIQWLGAILAVLGSVSLAVMIRVWPAPARNPSRRD